MVECCLELGADLHVAQLMPLPFTVSCFSKIPIGFTFLVPAHPAVKINWRRHGTKLRHCHPVYIVDCDLTLLPPLGQTATGMVKILTSAALERVSQFEAYIPVRTVK